MNVLLIDDDHDLCAIVELTLSVLGGMTVTTANSGSQGIELAKQHAFDLIVLDVMMPGMDGKQTLLQLRKVDALRLVPVVFLTASVNKTEVEELCALSGHEVLTKPFEPEDLIEAMQSIASRPRKPRTAT
ncbi:MAG: two-component system OmpR family response regulator [Hyphomicrobiaceae bacterium]|jgi:two-component system OmpR family response regulator